MSTIQIIIIIITLIIFSGRLFFGVFKRFSPFELAAATTSDGDFPTSPSEYTIPNLETMAAAASEDAQTAPVASTSTAAINSSSSDVENILAGSSSNEDVTAAAAAATAN